MPTNHAFVLCLLSTSSIDMCILLDMNCEITFRQDWKLLGVLKLQSNNLKLVINWLHQVNSIANFHRRIAEVPAISVRNGIQAQAFHAHASGQWENHRPISCVVKAFNLAHLYEYFAHPTFVECKMRPDFRCLWSWGESITKRINTLWTDNKDVHYPMNEPDPVHVENLGREKARPDFFKPYRRFEAKIVPPRTPHKMSEYFDETLI